MVHKYSGERRMDERWLSVDDVSAHLGVRRDSIYKWIGEKGLPAHKVGRLWKFQREEVDEWVRNGNAADKEKE